MSTDQEPLLCDPTRDYNHRSIEERLAGTKRVDNVYPRPEQLALGRVAYEGFSQGASERASWAVLDEQLKLRWINAANAVLSL